ncbi:MAG: hypothetical protein ACI4I9_04225 [Porcipelethomonas sp.]
MKIKQMVKYSLSTSVLSYLAFFGIIFAIMHIGLIISLNSNESMMLGGIDSTSVVYLFVAGIVNYREHLLMGVQNGVSRKTYFISSVVMFIIFASIASAGDVIINIIGNLYERYTDNGFIFESLYEQLFAPVYDKINYTPHAAEYLKELIFKIALNFTALSGGMLTASTFCRLPKILKFIIPAVLYILIFVAFPIADSVLFSHAISRRFFRVLKWSSESIWNFTGFIAVIAAVLLLISFAMIRRYHAEGKK